MIALASPPGVATGIACAAVAKPTMVATAAITCVIFTDTSPVQSPADDQHYQLIVSSTTIFCCLDDDVKKPGNTVEANVIGRSLTTHSAACPCQRSCGPFRRTRRRRCR